MQNYMFLGLNLKQACILLFLFFEIAIILYVFVCPRIGKYKSEMLFFIIFGILNLIFTTTIEYRKGEISNMSLNVLFSAAIIVLGLACYQRGKKKKK